MAISKTTFAERMDRINSGTTTNWTVPGEGLATHKDERRFLSKTKYKTRQRSAQTSNFRPVLALAAIISGAVSVILARWIDFTFLDDAMAFADAKGIDAASFLTGVPTALALAVIISIFTMFVLGLRSRLTVQLQTAGFIGALFFEGDLVALAPELYARFYPQSWIADMMATAAIIT